MFLLNSRSHLFTATPSSSGREVLHPTGAHLLPKLRCQFAEFLNPSSLKRLRILILPTCVGLRYGLRKLKLRRFSWKRDISSLDLIDLVLRLNVAPPDLPKGTASTLSPRLPMRGPPNLLRLSIALTRGAGILTCFPSTTPFGLALGADSPCVD